jgi:hypothetical protein
MLAVGRRKAADVVDDRRSIVTDLHLLPAFDYDAAAELFSPRFAGAPRPLAYQRFASASAAIQFAIERLSPASLLGTYLQVDDERYDAREIRRLYERQVPLVRAADVAD